LLISDWIFHATYSKTSARSDYPSHSCRFFPGRLCQSGTHTLDPKCGRGNFNRHAAAHRHAADLAILSANFHARANEFTHADCHRHGYGHAACAAPQS
jgi:hypothetical protein